MTHSRTGSQHHSVASHRIKRAVAAALALGTAANVSPAAFAQVAPASQPTTAPSSLAVRPTTAAHGITTQPGGGILINFKDASIDSVLDELSSAAGFIVVKVVKPEGRVTLQSK